MSTHYCLDERGDLTWTTRGSPGELFVVCAVCDRPRADAIDERDTMKRRLRSLASNLAIAAGLERSRHLGVLDALQWLARQPMWPTWEPGIGKPAPNTEEVLALSKATHPILEAQREALPRLAAGDEVVRKAREWDAAKCGRWPDCDAGVHDWQCPARKADEDLTAALTAHDAGEGRRGG